MHTIENFVHDVCELARKDGVECQRYCLRASSLQCLSAMVHLIILLYDFVFNFFVFFLI